MPIVWQIVLVIYIVIALIQIPLYKDLSNKHEEVKRFRKMSGFVKGKQRMPKMCESQKWWLVSTFALFWPIIVVRKSTDFIMTAGIMMFINPVYHMLGNVEEEKREKRREKRRKEEVRKLTGGCDCEMCKAGLPCEKSDEGTKPTS